MKIKRSLALLLILCFSFSFTLHGAEIYTLTKAKEVLLQKNEALAIEKLNVREASSAYDQAVSDKNTGTNNLDYKLNQEILPQQKQIAYERAKSQLEKLKIEKSQELENNFYQGDFSAQELNILQKKLANAEKQAYNLALRYELGQISKLSFEQESNNLEQLKVSIASKQLEKTKISQSFALLLNLDADLSYKKESLSLPESSHYSQSDLEAYISKQLSSNKEYTWLQQEAELAIKEAELTGKFAVGSAISREIAKLQAEKKQIFAKNAVLDYPITYAQALRISYYQLEIKYYSLLKNRENMVSAASQLQKLEQQLLRGNILASEVDKAKVSFDESKLAYEKLLVDYYLAVANFQNK